MTTNPSQQFIESCFMGAFARAEHTCMVRRLNRALTTMQDLRQHTPEGRTVGEVRRMARLRSQLAKAGVRSSLARRPGAAGIAIHVGGITHTCWTWQQIDATLTMISKGGAS